MSERRQRTTVAPTNPADPLCGGHPSTSRKSNVQVCSRIHIMKQIIWSLKVILQEKKTRNATRKGPERQSGMGRRIAPPNFVFARFFRVTVWLLLCGIAFKKQRITFTIFGFSTDSENRHSRAPPASNLTTKLVSTPWVFATGVSWVHVAELFAISIHSITTGTPLSACSVCCDATRLIIACNVAKPDHVQRTGNWQASSLTQQTTVAILIFSRMFQRRLPVISFEFQQHIDRQCCEIQRLLAQHAYQGFLWGLKNQGTRCEECIVGVASTTSRFVSRVDGLVWRRQRIAARFAGGVIRNKFMEAFVSVFFLFLFF